MQERSTESNDTTDEPDRESIEHLSTRRTYFIRSWLNKFEKTKLEYYSVILGISGLSFLALGICILILIFTTYEHRLTSIVDCSVINVTHTHVKLCESYRCRVFNYCIPYVCTIIFVRYHAKNISYESKLFSSNNFLNSSCSYEPTSCLSRSRIQFEQITFLKQFPLHSFQTNQCCLHSTTEQPMICPPFLNCTQYSLSILSIIFSFFISLILILLGILTQFHLNDYFKSSSKEEEDFLNTILNFHLSNGTIRSSIEKTTPVNYEILTQTISQHNTPSTTTKTYPNENSLLFDIEEENKIFEKECLRSNYQEQLQNEILRQYQLDNEEVKFILNKIENDFKEISLPKNSTERIKYLLKTIDNLEIYFPNISTDSLSVDHRSSPTSNPPPPHVRFLIK